MDLVGWVGKFWMVVDVGRRGRVSAQPSVLEGAMSALGGGLNRSTQHSIFRFVPIADILANRCRLHVQTTRLPSAADCSCHDIFARCANFDVQPLKNGYNNLFYPAAFLIASNNVVAGNGLHKNAMPPAATAWRSITASSSPVIKMMGTLNPSAANW